LPTNSSSAVLIGSQRPSLLHLPNDRRGSAGPEAVQFAASAGLLLDDWQAWVLEVALSEQDDGLHSAFEIGLEVGRQNGKGSILEARQLAGLFLLGEQLQVHTAHEFRTTFEHFLRITRLIEDTPDLDRKVLRIRRGAGEQAIELKTGERLRFIARSSGGGRGFSGDTVYLDEAFAVTEQMMGALIPSLSARPNPQYWLSSSAPMANSRVLHAMRARAVSGEPPRLFYAAWCNEPGTDPDDWKAIARANPALGHRITPEFVEAERAAMPLPEFLRERLGIPDPLYDDTVTRDPKIPADAWAATITLDAVEIHPGEIVLAFDCSPGGEWSSIAIAAGSLDRPYVELIEHQTGTGWLAGRLVELIQTWRPTAVICDAGGPAGAVVGGVVHAMRLGGLSADLLHQATFSQMKQACGAFLADVLEGRLRRPPNQGPLDNAAADATDRRLGESWAWDRRSATVPISPLVAVTLARSLLSLPVDTTTHTTPFVSLDDF
jgi:hypothetical protein